MVLKSFCVQTRRQISCKMKGLQLLVNNVDQCSTIFNRKDFSYAALWVFIFKYKLSFV